VHLARKLGNDVHAVNNSVQEMSLDLEIYFYEVLLHGTM